MPTTFKDLYDRAKNKPTPAQQFIMDCAKLTNRKYNTVLWWILGYAVPDDLTKRVIGEHFGVDPNELFPNKTKRPRKRK